MISALQAAASGMEAQQSEIENIANNLANVQTPGFKRSRTEFQDLLYETLQEPGAKTSALTQSPIGIQRGLGVKVVGVQKNFEIGAPQKTDRELDVMVNGEGFFVVQLPNGELGFKRDGSFHRSPAGRIETLDGYPIQPEIFIPKEANFVSIDENGTVSYLVSPTQRQELGQVQLATFVNKGGLKAIGKNIFVATEGSGAPEIGQPGQGVNGVVLQRYLEGSNVKAIEEMTSMISAQRAFEMNSKVIQSVDQMLQQTAGVIR